MSERSLAAAEKFYAVCKEKGAREVGEYVKSVAKVRVVCGEGHTSSMRPTDIQQGYWCLRCAGKCPQQAEENFRKKVDEHNGQVVGVYVNNRTKVELQCAERHTFTMSPSNVQQGQWCPRCAGKCPQQAEENFRKIVEDRQGQVIGVYAGVMTKVKLQCAEGHVFQMRPYSVQGGQWCPRCADRCPQQAEENFRKTVEEHKGQVIGTYITNRTEVELQCAEGHAFQMRPSNVQEGQWCPRCADRCPQQAEENFRKTVEEHKGQVVGTYTDTKTKVELQCAEGHAFPMRPNCVQTGRWCPTCAGSIGERHTRDILEDIFKTSFAKQRPTWLINGDGNRMELDGYADDMNLAFEYHGRQHYEEDAWVYRGDVTLYEKRQRDDAEKRHLCAANNVTLIEIPQYDTPYDLVGLREHIMNILHEAGAMYV